MGDVMEEHRKAVALFRFEVLAPVLNEPSERTASRIRVQAAKVWDIPGSSRMRVAEGTIYDWLRLYRSRGFDGLLPKSRRDGAKPRRMPPDAVDAVLSIKGETPELSIRQVIRRAREMGAVPEAVPLPPSTLHRLFTREGLMVREQQGPQKDLRRWAFSHAGDLWQSDAMHGPAVRDERGRMRKTYLLELLDDATRVVPHGAFPVLGERVRVPAGVPGGGSAQGHPPAPLCRPGGMLPVEMAGACMRQAGRRFDPRAGLPSGWEGAMLHTAPLSYDLNSFRGPANRVFLRLCRFLTGGFVGHFVETLVATVDDVSAQQTVPAPLVDGGGCDLKAFSDFADGQQPTFTQALIVELQTVIPAQGLHAPGMEAGRRIPCDGHGGSGFRRPPLPDGDRGVCSCRRELSRESDNASRTEAPAARSSVGSHRRAGGRRERSLPLG